MQIHLVPVLLGGGLRLFDDLAADPAEFVVTRVVHSPAVTHQLRRREVSGLRARFRAKP